MLFLDELSARRAAPAAAELVVKSTPKNPLPVKAREEAAFAGPDQAALALGRLARINPTARNGVFAVLRERECVVRSERYQHAVFNIPVLPALRPHHRSVELDEEMCSGRRRRFGGIGKALHMRPLCCTQAARSVEATFASDPLPGQFAAQHLGCEFAGAFGIITGAELRRHVGWFGGRLSVLGGSSAAPAATGEKKRRDRQTQTTPHHFRQPTLYGRSMLSMYPSEVGHMMVVGRRWP